MNEHKEKDCRKAYFLEGKFEGVVQQIRQRFLEQDNYIRELEKRITQLENAMIVCDKEKR